MKQNLISETFNIIKENYIYQLNIETNENKIIFTINLLSNTNNYYYTTKININELFEKLGLNSNKFTDSKKVLNIFNQFYLNNKISIEQKNDNSIYLIIYYTILYEQNKLELKLDKGKITIEDKLNILYNQIKFLTNKIKSKDEIKNNTNEINELNISINEKEKQLKNLIEEKDNIIDEISNKLLNQEKIIKKLNSNYNIIIINKIDEIENNIKINFDKYKQEINDIKNILINDINNQLNLQNNIIKKFINNSKNISFNEEINSLEESLNIHQEEIKKKIKIKNIKKEESSISSKTYSENNTNEKKLIKEILKEMNSRINQTNIKIEENKKQTIEKNSYDQSSSIKFNVPENINSEKILTESDFEIQENTLNYINYQDKINYRFKRNPKDLKFKLNITYTNTNWGANDIFEVFLCFKDNIEYLISPNYINYNLEIYSLLKFKLISSLEGHKNRITLIRYFIDNKNNNKEYLLSADSNKVLIIWDVTNNNNIKFIISTQYGATLYSSLLFFAYNTNSNYIITSTWNTSEEPVYSATKIFSLNNGEYIKYIKNTNNEKIYYLLPWYNKQNNKYYIVQFAYKKIIIYNFIEDELYSELVDKKEYYHYSGFIYTKNNIDFLGSSASNGYIKIWNLYEKKLYKFINTDNCCLFHIINWNDNYIIVADYSNKSFKIIDLYSGQIIKDFNGYHSDAVKCIKKIFHPVYGECLLSSGEDKTIKFWVMNVV